ncbi:hypothetical protein Tco_0897507 [Tanacetum coccineum]
MSDSEDFTVTYTEVSSPFKNLSDIGSPGVDGLPMMLEDPYVEAALQAPPSPDYVPGPEHPPSPVYVPYVPEPVYPEFMPPDDDVLPAEEQPLPVVVSLTADSPGYITESNPEEDPEKDDEDPEEDPANYPDDRDDDDEEEESFGDDANDDEENEDEEEEHPDPADSVPPPVHRILATPTPPPSGTPPLLPIPLPTLLPPLLLPFTDYKAGVSEVTLPPRKRLCITLGLRFEVGKSSSAPTARPTTGFRADYGFVGTLDDEIRRDPEREVGYGITDTWDEMVEDLQGTPAATDVARLSQRMTDFVTIVRQDTNEIYRRLDDAQDDRLLMSGQLNMLRRDRRAYARTARLMETKARLSRKAWVQSMDASDTARFEVRALRTTVLAQQTKIAGLRAADRTPQA